MCGIAAFFDWHDAAADLSGVIRRMCDVQASRGPDGQGQLLFSHGGLGHRRLAIIDPAGGAQPMSLNRAGLHLTFNGEIYNFRELRAELESLGHSFTTHTDSEVLLHAFQAWGPSCVARLRGMFAFVVYDEQKDELFVARDHLGIKPLVYAHKDGRIAIASELRALRCVPWFKGGVDRDAVAQYLHLGFVAAPACMLEGAKKLPPGHSMRVTKGGQLIGPEPFWRPVMEPAEVGDPREWVEEVARVCEASVKAHLVADVPFGAFLSGGVDSTLIVSWMQPHLQQAVKAFTISYDDKDHDETEYAKQAADHLGAELECTLVQPNAMDLLPRLVEHLGEPLADRSMVSTWLVSEAARRRVPMVLSGDGGDELFFGYEKYFGWMADLHRSRQMSGRFGAIPLRQAMHLLKPSRYPRMFRPGVTLDRLWYANQQFPDEVLASMIRGIGVQGKPAPCVAQSLIENKNVPDELQIQACDLNLYLPFDILFKVDASSMAHGLEVRTPLVDREVFDVARRLPVICRTGSAEAAATKWEQGKKMLKTLLARRFDDDFVNRPKKGFLPPVSRWLGAGTKGRAQAEEMLLGASGRLKEMTGCSPLRAALQWRDGARIWHLLVLEEWLRQNG
ncbi:MAG: asparagine synthase (glutamine-hydrolyzing) [Verrucomicrobiales bacterium]|nr:asparagine synthase (glutamine-hydrolyzing) [Verrucomicrobiales bacterium]MCP5559327.1 asparagine synthase (glutamine-hydrolyzing) [Verrucomicrobiaceae bacterium]